MWAAFMLVFISTCAATVHTSPQLNGNLWYDDRGKLIQAHGGSFLQVNGTYYWYGETAKTTNYNNHGFNCYSSKDMLNWHFEGQILSQSSITNYKPGPYRLERPRVIHNAKTKKYVMWFNLDNAAFAYHDAGVCTSDNATGPFTFLYGLQPAGQGNGDPGLYQDPDGTAFYFWGLKTGKQMGISKLTDNYLNTTIMTATINDSLEAPALFKHNGSVYLVTSHRNYWKPTTMALYRGGPSVGQTTNWTYLGNPTNDSKSFNTQSTFVTIFQNTIVCQTDRWNAKTGDALPNAKYVWFQMVPSDDNFVVRNTQSWQTSALAKSTRNLIQNAWDAVSDWLSS